MQATTSDQVLRAAMWIIDNVGWTQRSARRDKLGNRLFANDLHQLGSVCAIGAVFVVDAPPDSKNDAHRRLDRTCLRLYSTHCMSYNDRFETTKEDILQLFQDTLDGK